MENKKFTSNFTLARIAELIILTDYIVHRIKNIESKRDKKKSIVIKNFENFHMLHSDVIERILYQGIKNETSEETALCLILLIREFFLHVGNPNSKKFMEKFIILYQQDFKSDNKKNIEKTFLDLKIELHKMEKSFEVNAVVI